MFGKAAIYQDDANDKNPAMCEFICRAADDRYTAAEGASALGVRCKTR